MIVRTNKTYETHSLFPNTNFYESEPANLVVDETTEEGRALAAKIMRLAPYMDFVIQDGQLVDVIPTERPPELPPEKPLTEEVSELKAENTDLRQQLAQTNADAVAFQEFIFANFPNLA